MFLWEALGENLFPCLLHLLEAAALFGSWALPPSLKPATLHLSDYFSVITSPSEPLLLLPSYACMCVCDCDKKNIQNIEFTIFTILRAQFGVKYTHVVV